MLSQVLKTPVSQRIWQTKYRYKNGGRLHDECLQDSWRRVAHDLAGVESKNQATWEKRFYHALENFRFLPGGRIFAGAGTDKDVTLFNCFAMGSIGDSIDGIFDALKEGALTMQQGGGIGYDFLTLRPKGTLAARTGSSASGPVSFMRVWDSMCATLLSSGTRRGAMMATLRCDHPDIEEFIKAKANPSELRNFNLSVLVSDEFMQALQAVAQRYVDNAISKTIYVSKGYDFSAFLSVYEKAFEMGLKGCTTFRVNPVTGAILTAGIGGDYNSHRCDAECVIDCGGQRPR